MLVHILSILVCSFCLDDCFHLQSRLKQKKLYVFKNSGLIDKMHTKNISTHYNWFILIFIIKILCFHNHIFHLITPTSSCTIFHSSFKKDHSYVFLITKTLFIAIPLRKIFFIFIFHSNLLLERANIERKSVLGLISLLSFISQVISSKL